MTDYVEKAAQEMGLTVHEMLEESSFNGIAQGVCTTCGFVGDGVEPDACNYECEDCGAQTYSSVLAVAGII